MKSKITLAALAGVLLLAVVWNRQRVSNPSWELETMGTRCHITLSGSVPKNGLRRVQEKITAALDELDAAMSTWNPDSEISRFNAFRKPEPVDVSPEFARVVRRALMISRMTGGAFDPTVKPLVDHWGFGAAADSAPIERILQSVGWQKVLVKKNTLIKTHPELQLDLSAIAKGYGVDAVARVIQLAGFKNFLVEIGGEIVAAGTNPHGDAWRIGIESPDPGAAFGERILKRITLSGRAMATSGSYRNFRSRADGSRYSHIINPATGMPAESDVASVSVLAASCMDADAAATALFVMGSEKGLALIENTPGMEALFVLHAADETFAVLITSGFPE
jgi:thiamine biosynthesis lipoprotein